MTIIKILLGLRSSDLVPIHFDKVHSKNVAWIAHILKVHCRKRTLSAKSPLSKTESMLTLIVSIKSAGVEYYRLFCIHVNLDIPIPKVTMAQSGLDVSISRLQRS